MSSLFVALQVMVRLLWQRILSIGQWLLQNLASGMAVVGRRWTGVGTYEILGPEEGVAFGPLAPSLGGCLTLGVVCLVIGAVLIGVVAPPLLAWIEFERNDKAYHAYLVQIQREILTREGAYPGVPPDLGRNWEPNAKEQERLNKIADLNSTVPTSGGTGASGSDDQFVEDFNSLNEKKSDPCDAKQGAPCPNSDTLDEAALQAQRLAVVSNIDEYNRLIEKHRALYRQHNIDPCKSPYFPQGCQ